MKIRVLSIIVAVSIILCLCSCGKDNNENIDGSSSSKKNDTVSVSSSQKLETREDYLNALYGYYETDEAYVYISKDYYEEKSKIEEYDYRYGDVDAINVSMGDNNITTYEISVYRQFVVYYVFDGTELKISNGSTAKRITKEIYDKIPLKTYTYTPPVSSETQSNGTTVETEPDYIVPISKAKVGDIIYFGNYEQDNILDNGKEKIEWLVLAKEGNYLVVISHKILDRRAYHADDVKITWENCELRKWLNSDFLNNAFTKSEQQKIPTITAQTSGRNVKYTTDGGNDTQDKVFCLSYEEISTFLSNKASRTAERTPYQMYGRDGGSSYWLRTPGDHGNETAMKVLSDGRFDLDGNFVEMDFIGVRPAICIEIH
ncbi:MAG: hypothetical protein IJE65_04070 [Clostridia bacterium]|nr:hypothetical protein [Clostridia bacterium]